MGSLSEAVKKLRDLVLNRGFLPQIVPAPVRKPELLLEEAAIFDGGQFIANIAPDATLTPLDEGAYVEVGTPAQIWAYAAHLMLDGRGLPTQGDLLLRVDLWVRQGAVSVGVTGPEGDFISQQIRSVGDGRTAVDLRLRGEDGPAQVIVRNAGHGVAKAVVERVQAYRVIEDPFAEIVQARAPTAVSKASKPLGQAFRQSAPGLSKAAANPLVSLILTVKDGMPYLEDALESVRRQSYRNLELVVQDCLSDDGTSERIASFDGAVVKAVRERDGGIGDANNRALQRCAGAIVGTVDSDNLLDIDTVARAVEHFASHPGDAVAYGSVRMISAAGADEGVYRPGPFDFLRFIACDLGLPWSTAFFNRPVCGDALWLDPALKTCVDFNTWLRLSHLPIAFTDVVQGSTRISAASMTCDPDNYEQFCGDKAAALRRYAETCAHEPLRGALVRHGLVGIYCWAAESIKGLAPDRAELIAGYYERAKAVDPASARVALAASRLF